MITKEFIKKILELGVEIARTNSSVACTVIGDWVSFDDEYIEKDINVAVEDIYNAQEI